jgi:FtsH-binding integral membrane protein
MNGLRRFIYADIDAIFLYQFVVYAATCGWAIYSVLNPDPNRLSEPLTWSFLVAPIVTLSGYAIRSKAGLMVAAAGDSVMAYTVGDYALIVLHTNGVSLACLLTAALSGCMLMRFVRDVGQAAFGPPNVHRKRGN